jgi:hypothetical protein
MSIPGGLNMRVRFAVTGVLVALAVAGSAPAAFAADSGSGTDGAGPSRPALTDAQKAAIAEFRSCMADHGVTLPEPGQARGSSGSDSATTSELPDADTLAKADAACRDKLPPPPGVSEAEFRAHQDAVAKYEKCLTDNGASVPVRIPGLHRAQGDKPAAPTDEERAAFEKAAKACADLAPVPLGVSAADWKAFQAAQEKFRACLKDQGVDLLDHAIGGPRGGQPAAGDQASDADRAKRKAAFDACADLRPDPPAGLRGHGGPGGGFGPGGPGRGGPDRDGSSGAPAGGTGQQPTA